MGLDRINNNYCLKGNKKRISISFSELVHILDQNKHSPFLCEIKEAVDNELHILICNSEVNNDRKAVNSSGNQVLNGILENCNLIEPTLDRKYEIVFENYIIYQVRNESYCSIDSSEICTGKYLRIFEKSKLLDYLFVSTDVMQFENGEFYPYQWRHFGIYTLNHIIDVVSHIEPNVYQYN